MMPRLTPASSVLSSMKVLSPIPPLTAPGLASPVASESSSRSRPSRAIWSTPKVVYSLRAMS